MNPKNTNSTPQKTKKHAHPLSDLALAVLIIDFLYIIIRSVETSFAWIIVLPIAAIVGWLIWKPGVKIASIVVAVGIIAPIASLYIFG